MRSLLDTEEEEDRKASEITLSTASLLGIFFGLVLVCGVFFGFGYSMGRGSGQGSQPQAALATPAAEPQAPAPVENQPSPEPAAAAEPQVAVKTPAKAAVADDSVRDAADEEAATPPAPRPAKKPSAVQEAAIASQAATPALTAAAAPVASQPMVQIAAVARREDADVLVTALRQRGYGVVIRSEPQDKLLHVQVGPFADRTQATAMKQKLLSDGYNAIIKQ